MMKLDDMVERIITEMVPNARPPTGALRTPRCNWCWVCPDCRTQVVEEIVENGANRVGAGPNLGPIHENLAQYIDHTLLKADATEDEINKLCQEAVSYGFASVCINPCWVRVCRDLVRGSGVLVCTVAGFPLGATSSETKAFETAKATEEGADEVDMVINVGKLKSGHYDFVAQDIQGVVEAAGKRASVKVILETCYLTDAEKIRGSLLAQEAGADFVKTSTGFGKKGATLGDVALMRKVVGKSLGVKAAGGIRDYEQAVQMIEAGATRLGASASIEIVGK